MLDEPSPATGDRRELGLGIDHHRESGCLEHGEIARRVRVCHGVGQAETLGSCELVEQHGAGLTGRRCLGELAGELSVALAHGRTDDLVEQRAEGLDDEVEGSGY
jgi:hypothetical protein